MGPLLFLIYINDLLNALLNQPRLYADDTCLLISSPNIEDLNVKSKTELHKCKISMDLNKLSLNINKTYSLLINPTVHHSSSNAIALFNIDGIQHVNVIKYLGIEIDSQLNFKSHIDNVQSKIAKGVGILFKLNKILTSNALLMFYYALVHPHLTYGILIWSSTYKSYLNTLQLSQNKAMRAITKQRWSDRITPIYRRLQVLKINDLYKLETAKFMHQFSDKSLPASFEKYFTRTTFIHCHSTRTSERNDYFLPHFSTTRLQRSIRFSGVKLWNSIPCKFKNISLKKFILEYKLHLINQYN